MRNKKNRNPWGDLVRLVNASAPHSVVTQEANSHMRGRASGEMMGLDFPKGMHCKMLNGKFVFRRANGRGCGVYSEKMPLELYLEGRLAEYKAEGNKVARNLNTLMRNLDRKGKKAHRPKADAVKDEILKLAMQHVSKGRSLNAFIAKRVGRSPRRVGQIRADEEKRKSSEKA